MTGIGEQRDGVREDAVDHLDDDEREVQTDSDREGPPVADRPMRVPMVVMTAGARSSARLSLGGRGVGVIVRVRVLVMIVLVMIVQVGHAMRLTY